MLKCAMSRLTLIAVAFAGFASLAACDTAEERAEKHFQSGMALLEAGDVERALVEFRNVFQLDGYHLEARMTYARIERDRGDVRSAYGHYLRVVEQYPEEVAARVALSELAMTRGDWEEVTRHATAAHELAPERPDVRALMASVDYSTALRERDVALRHEAAARARELAAAHPELGVAHRVAIDDRLREEDLSGAIEAVDAAIAAEPDAPDLHRMRLGTLERLGRLAEVEAQLEDMLVRFPDDASLPLMLVRWHLAQGDTDRAETHMRERVAVTDEGRVVLLQFLREARGEEAMRAEFDRIIADPETESPGRFRALRALLDFETGGHETAIAGMEALIAATEPSDDRRNFQVMLARMLIATGSPVGARATVEEVLESDPTHVEALKLKADWLIEGDRTQEAIVALREALGQSPRDPAILTALARAHEREGSRDLMAEMLALAVEASNRAPDESLRYARHLMTADRLPPAEQVLVEALRLAPNHMQLLGTLGELYLRTTDWPRLDQVIATLRGIDDPQARGQADQLTARRLAAQERSDDLMGFLGEVIERGEGGLGALADMVRLRLSEGDVEGALEFTTTMVEQDPDSIAARYVHAATLIVAGRHDEAETLYRGILADAPQAEQVWLALHGLKTIQGETGAAEEVLDEALAALPESLRLHWARAGLLERAGDIAGALTVYEGLYSRHSDVPVIANNYASMLSMLHADDPASVERAYDVARRLRGVEVPPFQDTYGWIAFLRGDLDDALAHLEPAAAALADDPAVQFHLGMTYAALGRSGEARDLFTRVQEMVPTGERPHFMDRLEAELARLDTAGNGEGGGAD